MNIQQATQSYESWMRRCTDVVESDLTAKHAQMRKDLFIFFRGTYYRWTQLWPEVCEDLRNAPRILGVGDLHVGSYGTWRDSEGRLCWGVDDFDDSYPLPFTNDLVRLATSVKLLTDSSDLSIKYREGCTAILQGYEEALRDGGCPFVLAEHEVDLERLGIESTKPPPRFWEKLLREPVVNARKVPPDARGLSQLPGGLDADGTAAHQRGEQRHVTVRDRGARGLPADEREVAGEDAGHVAD